MFTKPSPVRLRDPPIGQPVVSGEQELGVFPHSLVTRRHGSGVAIIVTGSSVEFFFVSLALFFLVIVTLGLALPSLTW